MSVVVTASPPASDRASRRAPDALSWAALGALGAWALIPIVWLLLKARGHDSLTGAENLFAGDQMQYLAWIRSSGMHILAANDFDLRQGGHVYLQPMFLISGLLWRAGLNIVVSYLLWLPVAVAALYFGFRRFIWRTIASPAARAATLILALFFITPADPLAGWTFGSNGLVTLGGELGLTGALYGYFPAALAVGLVALAMVELDEMVTSAHPSARRVPPVVWAAAAGALASWIHPWQGATALVVILGLLAIRRDARLLIPAVATALPLLYYIVLPRIDIAWKVGSAQSTGGAPNPLLLLPALAPLLLPAIPAVRGGVSQRPAELALWLWPAAAIAVYFASPQSAPHALEGLVLPLAILAARGWQRTSAPSWAAVLAVAALTIPGLAYNLKLFGDAVSSDSQALLLRSDEKRALAYLARAQTPGGVLPSLQISALVPAYTGRRTWLGHNLWTPGFDARVYAVTQLFSGSFAGPPARRFLRQLGARYVLDDCQPGFDPSWLGSLLVTDRRFGCVRVLKLAVPNRAAAL